MYVFCGYTRNHIGLATITYQQLEKFVSGGRDLCDFMDSEVCIVCQLNPDMRD